MQTSVLQPPMNTFSNLSVPPSALESVTDEERGEERSRHHNDRLLAGRLEREQEKVLRYGGVSV